MSSTPSESDPVARLRASDAEREEIAQIVREAVGDGRLDMAEGDQRLSTVYAARYRDELNPIVNDLPAGQARLRPAGVPGVRNGGERGTGHGRWRAGPGRSRVGIHLGSVALIFVGLVAVWAATGSRVFWPVFPLLFLSFWLVRHWRWARWSRRW